MVQFLADILIKDKLGKNIAIIEIKNIPNLSEKAALQFSQMIYAHKSSLNMQYFMLLSREWGYLFKKEDQFRANKNLIKFPTTGIINRYVKDTFTISMHSHSSLELIFFNWLNDLKNENYSKNEEPEATLSGTNFLKSIVNADVILEAEI